MVTRRLLLTAAALALTGLQCGKPDCSLAITDAHLARLQSYANFFKLIHSLLDLYLRKDYVATLTTIAATIDNPTIKRVADDLIALMQNDALGKIKAGLPMLARTTVDLALKVVDDPTALVREKVIEIIKRTTFVGDLDVHANAIEAAPAAIRAAREKHDRVALAATATATADALRYFHRALSELRTLGATKVPYIDVSLVDAIAFSAGRPTSDVTATLDTALGESLDVTRALDSAATQCSAP